MEFHQVKYFLAVCDHMNFTKAAAFCHVSQPALTKAIQKLEAELGSALFIRDGRHFELTGLGRAMRTHLAKIDETRIAARRAARAFVELEMTELNVGIMCTVGPSILGPAMLKLQREASGIELVLHDVSGDQVNDLLLSGAIDCAIQARMKPLPERFEAFSLYSEPFVLAMGRGYPLASENRLALQDLAGQVYFDRLRCEFRNQFMEILDQHEVLVEVAMRSEREDWILSRISAGHGISMIPLFSIFSDQVVSRRLEDLTPIRTVEFVTVADRVQPKSVGTFAEILRQHDWPSENWKV
ncbi:MAG: LysR family transcriptional regulator [Geminicoccales bacterium]